MQVVLTHKQSITAKSGKEYVIFRGIAETGDTVEAFLTKEQADAFDIPDSVIASKSQLKEVFSTLAVADIEYNQRGRVETIKA